MTPILVGAALGLLVGMGLLLVRLLSGPTLYDRALAANAAGTKAVLLICVLCFLADRPIFLDIAIAYAMINFVTTIALLKFFRYRTFQPGFDQSSDRSTQTDGAS
jgi:multicomponent Na+:H+ antiporter subunit F